MRVGSGDFMYEFVPNWGRPPAGYEFGGVPGGAVDGWGRVHVFTRTPHPVLIFDAEGNFIKSWGEGVFSRPHNAFIGPDESFYCIDDFDHTVRKCTYDGQILMTLGTKDQPTDTGYDGKDYHSIKRGAGPFNRPTSLGIGPGGELYVSDGYGNSRVHKFSPDGKLIKSWGGPGTGPGEFSIVHTVCVAKNGTVYVSDRENYRIQLFTADGDFIEEWTDFHRPCGMFIGSPIYLDRADYVFQHTGKYFTSWVSEDHDPEWYIEKTIEENQGNLVIVWDGSASNVCLKAMADWLDLKSIGIAVPEPDWENRKYLTPSDWDVIEKNKKRFGAGFLRLVKNAKENGLCSYGIYSDATSEWIAEISGVKGFLGYNTGEKFSFDIEGMEEADSNFRIKKAEVKADFDLETIANNFRKSVKKFIDDKKAEGWQRFLITSASFHLDVEIAAAECEIIPHIEAFAFRNINFGAALCRGLFKQFDLFDKNVCI